MQYIKTKGIIGLVILLLIPGMVATGSIPPALADDPTSGDCDRNHLSAVTEMELAKARCATAKYHDIAQAEADGYVNFNLVVPGAAFHYVKFSLIDGHFDPAQPQMLLYTPVPGEHRLELAGVEYLVPRSLSSDPPEGFTCDADQWVEDSEGFALWELNAWIWLNNPEGVFVHDNPVCQRLTDGSPHAKHAL